MKIILSKYTQNSELPLKLKISFEAIFEHLETIASNKNHFMNMAAIQFLKEYEKYPELKTGFEDFSKLEEYNIQIDQLLEILFPELLQSNEIKAASIPFEFTTFKLSKRFKDILENAGPNYELKLRNFDESKIYILACTFILSFHHKVNIDFRRPFFFDIPDLKTGITKHYRTLFNADFFKVKPLQNAPEISEDDIKILLDNFDNIAIWKEKFPPNSYEFTGFGIMNLFDVTSDQSISNLKENLLRKDDKGFEEIQQSISTLYSSTSIKFGFSTFNFSNQQLVAKMLKPKNSYLVKDEQLCNETYFCKGIIENVFLNKQTLAISDIDEYGKKTNFNGLYQSLHKQEIQSVILVPLKLRTDLFAIMELVSKNKYELNSINASKLQDVVPVFKIAVKRYIEEFDTKLESVIQENYTSIHPTVKWRFYEEAEKYLFSLENGTKPVLNLKNIVFENIIPLYGQIDIKGSSNSRNKAIQQDLTKQLKLASEVIEKASSIYKLPIYNDLIFRINQCQENIKKGLNTGDEISLTTFLKKEIYPVFNHLKTIDSQLNVEIENYMSQIDNKLQVVYDKRKKYEDSVNTLNEDLATFMDTKQIEAQKMFPHYFERYKTDGLDFNLYIGQSMVKNAIYNSIYLQNLRLWQLQVMCEMEQIVHELKITLEHPLNVASLILVHSNPLAIKFRMDEKRFDVDGAYNIRYEIIKKRIDKAKIINTDKRITEPGKIVIVYSQNSDALEYEKYIRFLQSKNCLNPTIEYLDIEDLQGVSGLKALRVAVNYNKQILPSKISINDIMEEISNNSLN